MKKKLITLLIGTLWIPHLIQVGILYAQSDSANPQIIDTTLLPETLNLESDSRFVGVTVIASDSSGIQSVTAYLTNPATGFKTTSKVSSSPLSTANNQETHFITLTLPDELEEGTWDLTVNVTDKQGNTTSKTGTELPSGMLTVTDDEMLLSEAPETSALFIPSDLHIHAFGHYGEAGEELKNNIQILNNISDNTNATEVKKYLDHITERSHTQAGYDCTFHSFTEHVGFKEYSNQSQRGVNVVKQLNALDEAISAYNRNDAKNNCSFFSLGWEHTTRNAHFLAFFADKNSLAKTAFPAGKILNAKPSATSQIVEDSIQDALLGIAHPQGQSKLRNLLKEKNTKGRNLPNIQNLKVKLFRTYGIKKSTKDKFVSMEFLRRTRSLSQTSFSLRDIEQTYQALLLSDLALMPIINGDKHSTGQNDPEMNLTQLGSTCTSASSPVLLANCPQNAPEINPLNEGHTVLVIPNKQKTELTEQDFYQAMSNRRGYITYVNGAEILATHTDAEGKTTYMGSLIDFAKDDLISITVNRRIPGTDTREAFDSTSKLYAVVGQKSTSKNDQLSKLVSEIPLSKNGDSYTFSVPESSMRFVYFKLVTTENPTPELPKNGDKDEHIIAITSPFFNQ